MIQTKALARVESLPRRRMTPRRKVDASERRRMKLLELLIDVTRKLAAFDTLDEVLHALVAMTTAEVRAERGSLFLDDPETNELYSRVAQGNIRREIRLLNDSGIAGYVFTSGKSVIIHDAYADPRFNRTIDEQTGFVTRNVLCVPLRTVKGSIIGVAQTLNKKKGNFTRRDLTLLEAMTTQGTFALQGAQFIERMQAARSQEMEFIDIPDYLGTIRVITGALREIKALHGRGD